MPITENRNKDPGLGAKTTPMSSFKKVTYLTEQLNGKSLARGVYLKI